MRSFSKTSLKTAATITLMCIGAALAQFNTPTNARVSALSGAHVSDISGAYRYPVLMTGYLNHVQTTWVPSGGGGFIGVKSIGDIFSIGVLANQGLMSPDFTYDASADLNGFLSSLQTNYPPQQVDPFDSNNMVIPHLMLGVDLGMFALGADLFLEYGSYGEITADTTKYNASISHPGFRLSGKIDLSAVEILAKFGLGFPSIDAAITHDTVTFTRSSNEGLYMEMGAEADIPLGGVDLILGICYTQNNYRFMSSSNILGISLPDAETYTSSLFNAYFGAEFNFLETAVAMLGYSIYRYSNTTVTDLILAYPLEVLRISGQRSVTDPVNYSHIIYAGVENAWDKAWIFDSFQLRGGARYVINTTGGEASGGADTTTGSHRFSPTNYSLPAVHSRIIPTVGVGVSKSFATLDLSLNPMAWNELFNGPGVGMITATIKF